MRTEQLASYKAAIRNGGTEVHFDEYCGTRTGRFVMLLAESDWFELYCGNDRGRPVTSGPMSGDDAIQAKRLSAGMIPFF